MSTWLVLLVLIILAETDTAQCLCLNPSSLRVLRRSIRGGTFENAGNRILRMSSQGNGGGGGGLTKLDRKTGITLTVLNLIDGFYSSLTML